MSLVDLVQIIWRLPGVGVTILAATGLAVVVARPLARRTGGSPLHAGMTLVAVGVLLSVTLVPHLRWPAAGVPSEQWQRLQICWDTWPGAASHAIWSLEGRANIILFAVPALFATTWLRRPALTVIAFIGLAATVELLQNAISGGGCQASDLIANTVGASIGAVSATAVAALADRRRRSAAATATTGPARRITDSS